MISAVVQEEIRSAPIKVRTLFNEMLNIGEIAEINQGVLALRESYLASNILTKKSSNDALHVSLATVSECRVIVSWNFKHIVHFEKIPMYNAVNVLNGYKAISINTPSEVIKYEKE